MAATTTRKPAVKPAAKPAAKATTKAPAKAAAKAPAKAEAKPKEQKKPDFTVEELRETGKKFAETMRLALNEFKAYATGKVEIVEADTKVYRDHVTMAKFLLRRAERIELSLDELEAEPKERAVRGTRKAAEVVETTDEADDDDDEDEDDDDEETVVEDEAEDDDDDSLDDDDDDDEDDDLD